jgi:radical SAM protein with 4Fe4S-binding SPASM domain
MQKVSERIRLVSQELSLENTTYCGANCLFCPREEYSFKWEHMNTAFFKKIIDQAAELGMRSLAIGGFGDSFLDPEFEDKLFYVKQKYPFMKVSASSTCHVVGPDTLKWLGPLVDTFKISLFGTTKEVYEKIHGRGLKFEKVMENIKGVFALPKDKRPYIIMLFLVNKDNEHQVEAWKKQWEPLADEVMVWLPHNWAGKFVTASKKGYDENTETSPKSCGRPSKGNLVVRANGQVSMCCFDFNRDLLIGDLRQQTLKQVLAGEALRKIKEVHEQGTFSQCEYICKDCDQIHSRQDALLYRSNPNRKVGIINSHPDKDLMNDLLK